MARDDGRRGAERGSRGGGRAGRPPRELRVGERERTLSDDVRIRFLPSGRETRVPRGAWLTTAAARAGVSIVHDCDGQGVCGTCQVRIESGASGMAPPDPRERAQLGSRVDAGWRLCCLLVVEADCEVRVTEGAFAYPPEQQRGRPDGGDRA